MHAHIQGRKTPRFATVTTQKLEGLSDSADKASGQNGPGFYDANVQPRYMSVLHLALLEKVEKQFVQPP